MGHRKPSVHLFFLLLAGFVDTGEFSQESTRLLEDLMTNYNKLVRPARTPMEATEIKFKFKLLQILDVREKDQVLTTAGNLIHKWSDHRLSWKPGLYGNVTMLHIPGDLIWLPDIILYNNVEYVTLNMAMAKADVHANGTIHFEPPVIHNSMCRIDTQCWTYGGLELDVVHLDTDILEHHVSGNETEWSVEMGVDISEYQESVEFDLISVMGTRHEAMYPCCDYPVIDITYYLQIRRKKLFYTIFLMAPCICIAALTSFVFYLPSESHNKISLCMSILVSLTIFSLLLVDIVPPTSSAISLVSKYLLFTMVMVTASVFLTVVVQNIHFKPSATPMPKLVRRFFIHLLGNYILIYRRPGSPYRDRKAGRYVRVQTLSALHVLDDHFARADAQKPHGGDMALANNEIGTFIAMDGPCRSQPIGGSGCISQGKDQAPAAQTATISNSCSMLSSELRERVQRVGANIRYIERYLRKLRRDEDLRADWRFVAMVIDRIMLIAFSTVILGGTLFVLTAPALTDVREPITKRFPPKDIYADVQ